MTHGTVSAGLIQSIPGAARPFSPCALTRGICYIQKPTEAVPCIEGKAQPEGIRKNGFPEGERGSERLEIRLEPFGALGRIIVIRMNLFALGTGCCRRTEAFGLAAGLEPGFCEKRSD